MILSYTNTLNGFLPMPQHASGKSSVQNYLFPGALQPRATGISVLSWTMALLGIAFPQHASGMTSVQSYLYPGALQPAQPVPITAFFISREYHSMVRRIVPIGY